MHIFLLKQNNFKAIFLLFIFLSLILIIFNIWFPHEAFAMEPSKDWVTDYYGKKQYVGPDAYGYFNNCTLSTQQHDDIISDNPVELDGRALNKHVCKPEHKELNLWIEGHGITGDNPVIYELPSPRVDVIFELDADHYEDTISTSMNSTRFNEAIEFVRNYKVLTDYPKHGILTSISLGVKTTKNNIRYIYIKYQEIGRRKILWNIWDKNSGKYESYKHFKRHWDEDTSIFTTIRKDIRENITSEVEDLLGVKKINKNLKRSVRTEVEKLLRETRPFGR